MRKLANRKGSISDAMAEERARRHFGSIVDPKAEADRLVRTPSIERIMEALRNYTDDPFEREAYLAHLRDEIDKLCNGCEDYQVRMLAEDLVYTRFHHDDMIRVIERNRAEPDFDARSPQITQLRRDATRLHKEVIWSHRTFASIRGLVKLKHAETMSEIRKIG